MPEEDAQRSIDALDQKVRPLHQQGQSGQAIALAREMVRLAGARPCYEQALEINRRVLGNNHPHTVTSLVNLGRLEVASGEIDNALALMRQASSLGSVTVGVPLPGGTDQNPLERSVSISLLHIIKIELRASTEGSSQTS
jgi:ATP/maltotriose-dependent transcriptional regulator MalT